MRKKGDRLLILLSVILVFTACNPLLQIPYLNIQNDFTEIRIETKNISDNLMQITAENISPGSVVTSITFQIEVTGAEVYGEYTIHESVVFKEVVSIFEYNNRQAYDVLTLKIIHVGLY